MIWVYIGVGLAASFILFTFFGAPAILYTILFVRTSKNKWGRYCSIPDDEEYLRMYNIGLEWGEKYKDRMREVSITSCGFKLCGQYFDFGYDKAVIIIPGRMESCLYSYYFSEPYRQSGYNILAIDNRSHGLSEGKISSLGYKEYKDILNWGKDLHDELNNSKVILHGICIGASTALFALTDGSCPDYMQAMCADGMYINFCESFKNHLIERNKPFFPMLQMVMLCLKVFSGADVVNDGPIFRIDRLKKPILFLHSKADSYSKAEKAELLYEKCTSEKKIVWFPSGEHSRIRINHTEDYDRAITEWCEKLS